MRVEVTAREVTAHNDRTVVVYIDTGRLAAPVLPSPAHLHELEGTGTQRRWAFADVISAAGNTPCALTLHRWQDLVVGAAEDVDYSEGLLGERDLLHETEARQRDELWEAFATRPFSFVLPVIDEAVTANRA